ncbi:MAG TPA: DUF2309 family protein [Fuerstia sp.]|nr:DUF2309 family protein [Fuerstiella sp.]
MSMTSSTQDASTEQSGRSDDTALRRLRQTIEHCAHFLPAQGPITVFVHHNTLHAFEDLGFDARVQAGGQLFGCHAYLPEERYRQKLQTGRIRVADLEAVLLEDLGDEADRLVADFGTRYALQLAMLQFPFHTAARAELQWLVAETDALRSFRVEVDRPVRDEMIAQSREWALRTQKGDDSLTQCGSVSVLADALRQFGRQDTIDSWSDKTWEAFVLNYLWRVCGNGLQLAEGVHSANTHTSSDGASDPHVVERTSDDPFAGQPANVVASGSAAEHAGRRHRDVLLATTGEDTDLLVHDVLINFCAAFLDQGFADWELPNRESGLLVSFLTLYGKSFAAPTRWLADLRNETRRIADAKLSLLASITESLALLGVDDSERESFINQSLLALRGWAGMIWQMETNAEWAPHPAPAGSLVEFLAVRLILDRVALEHVARKALGVVGPLETFRETHRRSGQGEDHNTLDEPAFIVFQLAQVRGWKPGDLEALSREQWQVLVREIESFTSLERRRIYHRAFERKYRNETLDAVLHQCFVRPFVVVFRWCDAKERRWTDYLSGDESEDLEDAVPHASSLEDFV